MVKWLIMFPIIVLGFASLIAVGTIAGNGTTSITPFYSCPNGNTNTNCGNSQGSCANPTQIWSPFQYLTNAGCYLTKGITNLVFPIDVFGYANVTTTTVCYWFPAAGNPCATFTVTASSGTTTTQTSSNTVTCTTFGTLFGQTQTGPLGCQSSIQVTQSQFNPGTIQLGFLAIIFVIIGVAVISGIQILGSGLSPSSIYIIFKTVGYTTIWFILTAFSQPLFFGTSQSIPYPYGSLFYLGLSLAYLLGIYDTV